MWLKVKEALTLGLSECAVHRDLDKDGVDRECGSQLEEKVQDCRKNGSR